MLKSIVALLAVLFLAQTADAAPCGEAGSLVRAHTSVSGRHELAVFVFRLPTTLRYSVGAASPPFVEDPSDKPITVAGDAFTQVGFRNVTWMCEIAEAFHTPRQAIIDVKRTSQFEGMVSYVIGRSAASRFVSTYRYDTKTSRVVVVKFRR